MKKVVTDELKMKRDKNKIYPQEIDLNYVFVDLAGNQIPKASNEDGEEVPVGVLTLKDVIIEGLTMPDNRNVEAREKVRRWMLAQKVYKEDKIVLSVEEIVLIKDLIDKRFTSPLVVAQSIELLDPASKERS